MSTEEQTQVKCEHCGCVPEMWHEPHWCDECKCDDEHYCENCKGKSNDYVCSDCGEARPRD